jgi:hypothetical protein
MTDELFDTLGPEGRNEEAEAFEDQLVATGATLGWNCVCRNIDIFIKDGKTPSRGVDVLWAIRNPRDEIVEGWVGEAKRKKDGSTFSPSDIRGDVKTLREKVAKFDTHRFFDHPQIRRSGISRVLGGVLGLSSDGFDEARTYNGLEEIEFTHRDEGLQPTQVLFLGPSTLNGLADAIRQFGAPKRYLWPPTMRHLEGVWSAACPPQQLAAGLLAYKSDGEKTVLWVRDTLSHNDIEAFSVIASSWRTKFTDVAFTALRPSEWRITKDAWGNMAERLEGAGGRGPLPRIVQHLQTSNETMKEYDAVWQRAAA